MVKRTRKPPITPETRREWLRRSEEGGESPPQIAAKDYFDVRTVRKQIELSKQEREVREARSLVLRSALESHYNDLRDFAERLNSRVSGLTNVPTSPDDDLIEAALRQHLPRSPIWSDTVKLQNLERKTKEELGKIRTVIEEMAKIEPRLIPPINDGLNGVTSGIVLALTAQAHHWSGGSPGLTTKDNFILEPAGEGMLNPRYGPYHLGLMSEQLGRSYETTFRDVIDSLESKLRESEEYRNLEKTAAEIKRLRGKLREELAVIRLRRIVPGRCKYCPL